MTRGAVRESFRRAAMAAVVVTLGGYVLLHSPLRADLSRVLGLPPGCYFCRLAIPNWSGPTAGAAAALIAVAAFGAAGAASRYQGASFERGVVFGLTAFGLVTVPPAVLAGIASAMHGAYLRPPAGPLLAAIPAALVVCLNLRSGWRPFRRRPQSDVIFSSPLNAVFLCTAAALLLLSTAVSLLHPPSQGDALSYHAPLGVFLWQEGNLTGMLDRAPETWALAHPGTSEIAAGLLRLLGGERLADLYQLPAALLGAAAVAAFARRTGLWRGGAQLAGCSFLLVPIVALQVGTQANDILGAAFVMSALALASAESREWTAHRATAVGLALGLSAATKLAVLPAVAAVMIFAAVVLLRADGPPLRRARAGFLGLLAFVIVVGPWWIRNIAREANPIYPQALPILGRGVNVGAWMGVDAEFVGRKFAWPAYPLLEAIDDRSGFGALFCVALVPGLAWVILRGHRRPVLLLTGVIALTLPIWWIFTLHEPRFFLAYAGLGLVCVPWTLVAIGRRRRRWGYASLSVAALFTAGLAVDQQIAPLAAQPDGRSAFYERMYGVDPRIEQIPMDQGVLQVTGLGSGRVDYVSLYPLMGAGQQRRVVPLYIDPQEAAKSRDVVLSRMRRTQVRYVYVTAAPNQRAAVERLFAPPEFMLEDYSDVVADGVRGARRPLFREVGGGSAAEDSVRRYIFHLTTGGR